MASIAKDADRKLGQLGLAGNAADLRDLGYTMLEDPTATALADRVRAAILRLSAETVGPSRGHTAALLLGRDPVFSEVLVVPRLVALVESVLGRGALLSQLIGSVRIEGSPPLGMHVDNSWFPEPFPQWELTCTACLVTDAFTREGGCTYVVPGSHAEKRHPPLEVRGRLDNTVSLESSKGSIWLWTGSLWHGNYPRTLGGQRVVLHATFCRIGVQPIEDYRALDSAWLKQQPAAIATLLGRRLPFGTTTLTSGGVDPMRAVETYRLVHGRDGY